MKMKRPFSLRSRVESFRYAFEGLEVMLKTQHNARVQAFMGILAMAIAAWLQVGKIKFILILLSVVLVWMTESFNTVVENLVNMISPSFSAKAKRAKDIAASGVLIVSLSSFVVGLLILGPPLLEKILWMQKNLNP